MSCFLQEIVNGAAIQAKIPTALVRKQEGSKISCTSGTMDCVVSVYGFSGGVAAGAGKSGGGGSPATLKGLASEVARVLKPGGTVLFVEKGEAKELVRAWARVSGSLLVFFRLGLTASRLDLGVFLLRLGAVRSPGRGYSAWVWVWWLSSTAGFHWRERFLYNCLARVSANTKHEQVDELREALGTVEVNMVTNLVDPYCVAMATKTKVVSESE